MKNKNVQGILDRHIVRSSVTDSDSQAFVADMLDVLHAPPPTVTAEYVMKCVRSAARLRNPVAPSSLEDVSDIRALMPSDLVSPWGSVSSPLVVSSGVRLRNIAFEARTNVFDVVNEVAAFVPRSSETGFLPSENPFAALARMNSRRRGFERIDVPDEVAGEIVSNIEVYLDLIGSGRSDDDRVELSRTTQLSSARISFAGFGGVGNATGDLLKFVPDADMVRETKASEAAAVFDFSKRVPKVIFTANYSPDGESRGGLVGWRRIPDASGYIVTRRNMLDGTEVIYTLSNEKLKADFDNLRDYVDVWVMSFYDDLDIDSIWILADGEVDPHAYYFYTVQAFQTRKTLKGSVFSVATTVTTGSPAQRAELKNKMESFDPGEDRISPYPLLAQHLLGDAKYDWVLAGVNVRASVDRREPKTTTRNYSYLTAQMDFILKQMVAGKFVIPKDMPQVAENVNLAVSTFGVSQVIDELLRETGILYHFDGTDVRSDSHWGRVLNTDPTEGIIATILAAADPETATIDLRSLSTNLPAILQRTTMGSVGVSSFSGAGRTEEISAPDPDSAATGDDIQHFDLEAVREGDFADLTTFDGLSKFVRTIRVFADISANRADVAEQTRAAAAAATSVTAAVTRSGTVTRSQVTPKTPKKPGGGSGSGGGGRSGSSGGRGGRRME